MPITIDGTGNITGLVAGGLPDSSITNADLATDAVSTSKILNGAVTTAKMGSAEQSGLAKAWVYFNGTGTVAIRGSYNVSSITDNGTGDYTINFTTAMADANYCAAASSGASPGVAALFTVVFDNTNAPYFQDPTTTTTRISTRADTGTPTDSPRVTCAIFR
jgi:hypothetical protein